MYDYQTTLKSRVTLSGIGVHSGKPVSVTFVPADADTGVIFQSATEESPRDLRALVSEVGATDLCTMLGDPAGEHVALVGGDRRAASQHDRRRNQKRDPGGHGERSYHERDEACHTEAATS